MTDAQVSQVAAEAAAQGAAAARAHQLTADVAAQGTAAARAHQLTADVAAQGAADGRISQYSADVAAQGTAVLTAMQFAVEVAVGPEPPPPPPVPVVFVEPPADPVAPVLRRLAALHYQQLRPIALDDHLHGWAWAHYCAAVWGPVENIAALFSDQPDGTPGWAAALQVQTCPASLLGWLAQRVGVKIPVGTPDATARLMISATRGYHRGGPQALIADVKATLLEPKFVLVIERNGGPHNLTLITRTSQTPDPAATLAAANAPDRKRIGLLITHVVSDLPVIDEGTRTIDAGTGTIDTATLADVVV